MFYIGWTVVYAILHSPAEHLDVVEGGVLLQGCQLLKTQLLTASIKPIWAVDANVVIVATSAIFHRAQTRRALKTTHKKKTHIIKVKITYLFQDEFTVLMLLKVYCMEAEHSAGHIVQNVKNLLDIFIYRTHTIFTTKFSMYIHCSAHSKLFSVKKTYSLIKSFTGFIQHKL